MRNRRFSFWHHPLQLLSILLLLGGSVGAYAADTYDAATNVLTIPLVRVGNTAYTNVRITVGDLIGLGGGAAASAFDTYDTATNQLTIPSVLVGATTYTNVVITVGSLISVGGSAPVPASAPLLVLVDPLNAATVGQAYSANVVAGILPPSNYTYMIDTLANGALPGGMTIDLNGRLSGTPTVTGKTDVNGNQLPNTYTFGVCAVDMFSRVSTNPCPRTSITVNPATLTLPSVAITSAKCEILDPSYSQITVGGTVTGPVGTTFFFSDGDVFLSRNCPSWDGGFCTRKNADPLTSTWTGSGGVNKPGGGTFSFSVVASYGHFDGQQFVFDESRANGTVTCPRLPGL